MNITIKENAEAMLKEKLGADQFVRVGVTEGGCAGLTYDAEITDTMKDDEGIVYAQGDIRIVADVGVANYIDGLVIDYSDDLIHGGLQFTNEKSQSTCGCGQSFGLAGMPKIEKGNCTGS